MWLLLMRNHIDVNSDDAEGCTPPSFCSGIKAQVMQLLMRNDIEVKSRDAKGRTPLMLAEAKRTSLAKSIELLVRNY